MKDRSTPDLENPELARKKQRKAVEVIGAFHFEPNKNPKYNIEWSPQYTSPLDKFYNNATNIISLCDNIGWKYFANLSRRLKKIMDNYLNNKSITFEDIDWLESRRKDYRVEILDTNILMESFKQKFSYHEGHHPEDIFPAFSCESLDWDHEILLRILFLSLYNQIISVFIGRLKIQTCQRNGCNNIYLKSGKGSGNRKYCSECSNIKTYRENQNEVHQNLCYLIDKWLGRRDSMNVTAFELKNMLKETAKNEGITDTPFLSGATAKNLGQYLKHIEKMLKDEYGITYKPTKEGSEYTYHFIRIQS